MLREGMQGKDNVMNVEHDSYFLSPKIWASSLEPEGRWETTEDVRSARASMPSLDRRFSGDPTHHIPRARRRCAGRCPQEREDGAKDKPNHASDDYTPTSRLP